MITFYDNDFSTCCQKVRMLLAEYEANWNTEWLDLRRGDQLQPAYLKLNPNGVVPTITDGSRIIIESTLILRYLDAVLAGSARFTPGDPYQRYLSDRWMQRIDGNLHLCIAALSIGIAFRHELMASKSGQELQDHLEKIPNPGLRSIWTGAVKNGVADPAFKDAARGWDSALADMEAALAETEFVAGEQCTLADLSLLPYVVRLDHLGMLPNMLQGREHLARWYGAMCARPAFAAAYTDVISPKKIFFVRSCGERESDAVRAVLAEVRG